MAQLFIDGMVDFAQRSGGRRILLAVIPSLNREVWLAELLRCHDVLGIKDMQMSTHYGDYLDDQVLEPLFEKLEEYQMTGWICPPYAYSRRCRLSIGLQ